MADRQIMNDQDIRRALARVAHEILERNRGTEDLVIVGIHTRGVYLAQRLASNLSPTDGQGDFCCVGRLSLRYIKTAAGSGDQT